MLKSLIQVTQDSLTTAILLAMLFALVRLSDRQRLKMWLFWGGAAGVAAALVLAVLKHTTGLINREYLNIAILSVAVLAEIIFYIWAWGGFSQKAPGVHAGAGNIVMFTIAASLLLYSLPDIFLYPTNFLITGESIFGTDFLFRLSGYLSGLLLVIFAALALFKAGISLAFRLVRLVLTAGLAVNMVNQIVAMVQILLARSMIPMPAWLFNMIVPVINHNEYFLYALILISLFLPVLVWAQTRHPEMNYKNPAEHRKIRAGLRRKRRWCGVVLAAYVLAVLSLTAGRAYAEKEVVLSPAEPMTIVGQEIIIPLADIGDGHLHRYIYTASNGTEVRFIVIKKNNVAFGVGLDACDICGPTGYYERDDEVVCKLCDVVMNVSTIGFKGGCNPVPLAYSLSTGNMVIQTQNLEAEKSRFE